MTKRFRQGKKRNMDKFRIDELSGVDFPAQEGAVALLMKRKPDGERESGRRRRLEKRRELIVLTSVNEGHSHGLSLEAGERGGSTWYAHAPESEFSHDHAWTLDGDGNLVVAMNDGHDHTVDRGALLEGFLRIGTALRDDDCVVAMARKAQIEFTQDGGVVDLVTKRRYGADGSEIGGEPVIKEDPMSKPVATVESLTKRNEDLEKRLELVSLYGSFTDAQRSHFDKLDEAGKATFAKLDASGREAAISKAAEADPIVYTDSEGVEYRKSCDPVVLRLAKRADAAEKRSEERHAEVEKVRLAKRAESVLGNLPGESDVHVAIVRQLEKIADEDVRKAAFETIQAGNKSMKAAFTSVGHLSTTDPEASADAELTKLAKGLQKEDPELTFEDAYEKAGEANPELHARAIEGK